MHLIDSSKSLFPDSIFMFILYTIFNKSHPSAKFHTLICQLLFVFCKTLNFSNYCLNIIVTLLWLLIFHIISQVFLLFFVSFFIFKTILNVKWHLLRSKFWILIFIHICVYVHIYLALQLTLISNAKALKKPKKILKPIFFFLYNKQIERKIIL